ncbi:unnamed protein product [Dracunculus medinensis]|uniref:PABS domain-containing protein n=1 Tax=Dracunculus medinensis TaxID=318479 RepID=A0A0N4UCG1_DRAME|nr:unnamed protein product [Dracunculus medinensis]
MESNGKKERTHKREDILRIGENFVIYQSNASFLRVVDVILYGPNNWYIERNLIESGIVVHTTIRVMVPDHLIWPIDTTKWPIDYSYAGATYIAYMIAAAYAGGAISTNQSIYADILSIGLGGGSLNNFFRHITKNTNITIIEINKKMVDLAKTYFGLIEDDRQRCIVGDGAELIRKFAERGKKFDVIFLDACDTSEKISKCPSDVFMKSSIVKYFPKTLKKSGTLLINYIMIGEPLFPLEKVS